MWIMDITEILLYNHPCMSSAKMTGHMVADNVSSNDDNISFDKGRSLLRVIVIVERQGFVQVTGDHIRVCGWQNLSLCIDGW
jgi:hypothetical protein